MTSLVGEETVSEARYKLYLGPLLKWIEDEQTTSIVVNENGSIWVTQFNRPKFPLDETMPVKSRQLLVSFLASQQFGRSVDRLHSRLQCELPIFGSRVQAFCPPISNWPIIIRNHRENVVPFSHFMETAAPEVTLGEEWGEDRIRVGWDAAIRQAIEQRRNIQVGGGTKSGKTTFLNSLVDLHASIYPQERLVVVQDRLEIVAGAFGDHLKLMARVEQAKPGENGTTTFWTYEFAHAVEDAQRCDGDSLVWGEMRDPESAIGLGSASNTGTHGIKGTVHANAAIDVPARYEDQFLIGHRAPVKRQIAKVCELIIFMQRSEETNKGRIVDVQRVLGVDGNNEYVFEKVAAV